MASFATLPNEMQLAVICCLEPLDIQNLTHVNKHFHDLFTAHHAVIMKEVMKPVNFLAFVVAPPRHLTQDEGTQDDETHSHVTLYVDFFHPTNRSLVQKLPGQITEFWELSTRDHPFPCVFPVEGCRCTLCLLRWSVFLGAVEMAFLDNETRQAKRNYICREVDTQDLRPGGPAVDPNTFARLACITASRLTKLLPSITSNMLAYAHVLYNFRAYLTNTCGARGFAPFPKGDDSHIDLIINLVGPFAWASNPSMPLIEEGYRPLYGVLQLLCNGCSVGYQEGEPRGDDGQSSARRLSKLANTIFRCIMHLMSLSPP